MILITIVNGICKPTNITGEPHIVWCIIHFMDGFSMNEGAIDGETRRTPRWHFLHLLVVPMHREPAGCFNNTWAALEPPRTSMQMLGKSQHKGGFKLEQYGFNMI